MIYSGDFFWDFKRRKTLSWLNINWRTKKPIIRFYIKAYHWLKFEQAFQETFLYSFKQIQLFPTSIVKFQSLSSEVRQVMFSQPNHHKGPLLRQDQNWATIPQRTRTTIIAKEYKYGEILSLASDLRNIKKIDIIHCPSWPTSVWNWIRRALSKAHHHTCDRFVVREMRWRVFFSKSFAFSFLFFDEMCQQWSACISTHHYSLPPFEM